MKKFEIGKEYFDTSACDSNCVFVILKCYVFVSPHKFSPPFYCR